MGKPSGTQTLERAISLLEAAASVHDLDQLSSETKLTRSTAYRMLSTLVEMGYLKHIPREGYFLGPKLLELGYKYYDDLHLPSIARPHLERLTEVTNETSHLAVLEGRSIIYIDKVLGSRNLQMTSRIGANAEVPFTALGKSLICGLPENEWGSYFNPEHGKTPNSIKDEERFIQEIENIARNGYSLDMEENEVGVCCIASPLQDQRGEVIGAISISSASIYLDNQRIKSLIPFVKKTAQDISRELGWNG